MRKHFVKVKGKKIKALYWGVYKGELYLEGKGIEKISEIEGLDTLTDLQYLLLSENQIKEIDGLDTLTSLCGLALNNNQITEIKGLEKLTNLQTLSLSDN